MKTFGSVLLIAALAVFVGCAGEEKKPADDGSSSAGSSTETANVAAFCACGFEKGSEECCKGEKCEDCSYHKGSDLCCKDVDESAAGKTLCKGCGDEAGSEKCCADDAAKCDKCGLNAGSPLCCKVGEKAAE